MSRTANAARNLWWSAANRIAMILLPFGMRTILISVLGVEYAGLSSLFSSVIGMLSLAELGFGDALVYSMYEPMANGDKRRVSALLNFYRKCYLAIGAVIFALGMAVSPFLTHLIHGSVPEDMNIYILFDIYLLNTVLSYVLFAYRRSLLVASQRVDIDSNIHTGIYVLQNLAQMLTLLLFKNFYAYLVLLPASTVLSNYLTKRYTDRFFGEYRCEGTLSKEELRQIKKNVKGLICHKIGNTFFSSVDNIVISGFLGLEILGKYSNYMCVIQALSNLIGIIGVSITPVIGNYVVKESKDANLAMLKKCSFMETGLSTVMTACFLVSAQTFIRLWVGASYLLPDTAVALFAIYFYVFMINDPCYIYRQATGVWWEGRYMPLVSSAVNLALNLMLVSKIGIHGIILSTVISVLFVNFPWGTSVLFQAYFRDRAKMHGYLRQMAFSAFTAAAACVLAGFACQFIKLNVILSFFGKGIAAALISAGVIAALHIRSPVFWDTWRWGVKIAREVRGEVRNRR